MDHEGRITLFYNGGGIKPVKNYHYNVEIYCIKIPLTKYKPNANLSFLNNALDTLLNTILFISANAIYSLFDTLFFYILNFAFVFKHAKNNLVKYFNENLYMLFIFHN